MQIKDLKKNGYRLDIEYHTVEIRDTDSSKVSDKEMQDMHSVGDFLNLDSVLDNSELTDSDIQSDTGPAEVYSLYDMSKEEYVAKDLTKDQMDSLIAQLPKENDKNNTKSKCQNATSRAIDGWVGVK